MPLRATTLGFRNHPFLDIFLEKIHFHDSFYCKHSCNSNPSSRQYFLSAHDMLTLCVKHFITTHRSQGESESERVQATCLRFPSKWQTLDRNSSVWQQSLKPAQSGLPEALLVLGYSLCDWPLYWSYFVFLMEFQLIVLGCPDISSYQQVMMFSFSLQLHLLPIPCPTVQCLFLIIHTPVFLYEIQNFLNMQLLYNIGSHLF